MPSTPQTLQDRYAAIDAKFAVAEAKGTVHLARLACEVRALALPRGSYVVIEVQTGQYVTGPSRLEARTAFKVRFPNTTGWACRVEDLPPCLG